MSYLSKMQPMYKNRRHFRWVNRSSLGNMMRTPMAETKVEFSRVSLVIILEVAGQALAFTGGIVPEIAFMPSPRLGLRLSMVHCLGPPWPRLSTSLWSLAMRLSATTTPAVRSGSGKSLKYYRAGRGLRCFRSFP